MEIDTFLAQLASAEPVPGGGSAAALQTAIGAALIAMVARLTVGRKKYADVQEEASAVLLEADALMHSARRLVDADADAYGLVAVAMGLPRDTDSAKAQRTAAVQEALKGAAVPPLQTMRAAASVLALARRFVRSGNRSAVSDVATAAVAALAGFEAARLNVEINLALVRDDVWVAKTRSTLDEFGDQHQIADQVVRDAEAIVRGSA
jgi:methenyltetrahydrofolate cyclohydrolase